MDRIVLITGATGGIGLAMAEKFTAEGDKVWAAARREKPLPEGARFIPVDVTDPEAAKNAVDEVVSREGRIDVLINNAGFGISGAVEFTQLEDAKSQFNVNFFGMVNMTKAVLPVMRARRHDNQYQLRRGRHANTVSDILFRVQGGDQLLYYGASERGARLRHKGLRAHARRREDGLHRGKKEIARGGAGLSRARALRRPHGA